VREQGEANGRGAVDEVRNRFGLLVIGDEIVSGKRPDRHFAQVAGLMAARGLRLAWCAYLGDDRARLARFLRRTIADGDIVFSCGGIGNTPDDHTRQAAAAAFGVELALHPDAERELRARFGAATTPAQLLMGTFPLGSSIIANPFNRIPGFSLAGTHFFVPGFPQMAWPMIESVLDASFCAIASRPLADRALLLTGPGAYESALLDLMDRIVADYPDLRFYSLPSIGPPGAGGNATAMPERGNAAAAGEGACARRHLEIGVEGGPDRVAAAIDDIRREVERRGIPWAWRDQ
jgi:molybdopterin-biosynthesis enzyme MoeA-like protein